AGGAGHCCLKLRDSVWHPPADGWARRPGRPLQVKLLGAVVSTGVAGIASLAALAALAPRLTRLETGRDRLGLGPAATRTAALTALLVAAAGGGGLEATVGAVGALLGVVFLRADGGL